MSDLPPGLAFSLVDLTTSILLVLLFSLIGIWHSPISDILIQVQCQATIRAWNTVFHSLLSTTFS